MTVTLTVPSSSAVGVAAARPFVTVGVTAGYSHGAGRVHVTTAGSAYSGEMNGLPAQAQQYGYSFNWKLVGFLYQGKYPVVTYLVNSVAEPPLLPENFSAGEEDTTTSQIALEWDYSGSAAGFVLYRYFQSPSSSGYYKIGTVDGGDCIAVNDGIKHYQFVDEGLSPNTGYQYRIQTIGLSQPNASIPSEALSTYTKPECGTPQVAVSAAKLAAYPDTRVSTTAYLENSDEFRNAKVYYQWQKQNGRSWEDVRDETAATLSFQHPDLGVAGIYRCKVNALADQNLVTAYSPAVTVTFAQRASQITDLTIQGNTLTAVVKGSSAFSNPTGTVNFILTSANAETVYTAQVDEDGTASAVINPAADLYKVTATYSGSKIFLPAGFEPKEPLFYTRGVQSGSYLDVKDSCVYGDTLEFDKYTVKDDGTFTREAFIPKVWETVPDTGYANGNAIVKERFAEGRAGWVGTASFTEAGTAYTVTIVPRPIEIVGLKPRTFAYGTYAKSAMLEGVSVSNLVGDWAETDKMSGFSGQLALNFYNSAGEQLEAPGRAGAYTARISKTEYRPGYGLMHNVNYDLTCPTVKVIVTGAVYPVSAAVADGQTSYGSVSVAYPENAAAAAVGQTVIFRAAPYAGFAVKAWYTVSGEARTLIAGSEGADTLTMTQTKAGLHVEVEFQKKNNTLTVGTLPENADAGRIICDDKYFRNGNAYASGYSLTFRAEAADGWHFTDWEYYVDGQAVTYGDTESFTVAMPDESVRLFARFARDTYALSLSDGLEAYANGELITDLTAVSGGTEVTVRPRPGYLLDEDAKWSVDGAVLDPQPVGGTYAFTMTANTSISASVTAQTFHVVLMTEDVTGGTAGLSGTEDGMAAAGTAVTFTAAPARGSEFAGWKDISSDTIVSTGASYTFTVSGDVTLKPVFTPQESKTVTLSAGKNGSISWAIEGVDTTDESTVALYPGEILTLTAAPRDGSMVAGWTVNEQYTASPSRIRSFKYQELADGDTISVTFQPVTYFTVSFAVEITATADGAGITSGDSVAAGSELVFTYTGNDTVTRWLNGGAVISGPGQILTVPTLSNHMDISAETGELEFFTVTDATAETERHYTAAVTGTYAQAGSFAANSSVTITVMPEDGYRVTGVDCGSVTFTEDNGSWTGIIASIQENMTYTVSVEAVDAPPVPSTAFTITFNANGGNLTGAGSAKTGADGKLSALPADPNRDDYTFSGWYTDPQNGGRVTSDTVFSDDATIYAHWTKNSAGGESGGGSSGGNVSPACPVTPIKTGGGSVLVDRENAPKGSTVTVTVKPDAGYQLDSIKVLDQSRKELKLTNRGNGVYAFIMPGSEVTVNAVFKAMSGENPFADIPAGMYYADAVIWAAASGITSGVSETMFNPDGICTRAQAVTFLWRAAGSPTPASDEMCFTDVKAGSYYAQAVAWAVENGITNGTSAITFSPDAACSRGQIVTFLWRSEKSPASEIANPFADVKSGSYCTAPVLWAVSSGITNGISETAFSPSAVCTRAQIVTFLWRCRK